MTHLDSAKSLVTKIFVYCYDTNEQTSNLQVNYSI